MDVDYEFSPAFTLMTANLGPGESLKVEPGAMVAQSRSVDMKTGLGGGGGIGGGGIGSGELRELKHRDPEALEKVAPPIIVGAGLVVAAAAALGPVAARLERIVALRRARAACC